MYEIYFSGGFYGLFFETRKNRVGLDLGDNAA
jgi:hypothetical protein